MADGGEERFFFYIFLFLKEIKTELVFYIILPRT